MSGKQTKKDKKNDEVFSNAIGFLSAANEATSTTLSFASYLLALHPDVQEKLQSEIDDYFEEKLVSGIFEFLVKVVTRPIIWWSLSFTFFTL